MKDIVAANSHFPPEVVEHTKALAVRGFSLRRIEYALKAKFSDCDTPHLQHYPWMGEAVDAA